MGTGWWAHFYYQGQQYADSEGGQDVIIDDQLFLVTPRWEVLDDKVRDLDNRLHLRGLWNVMCE
jgi:hypothetical protein